MQHQDLNVWKESITLVGMVYQLVATFPKNEEYALSSQMRRCAVSIPSNIAEGCGRGSNRELLHFCNIASGSLSELETQIFIADQLGFADEVSDIEAQIKVVRKLLSGFKRHISEEINNIE